MVLILLMLLNKGLNLIFIKQEQIINIKHFLNITFLLLLLVTNIEILKTNTKFLEILYNFRYNYSIYHSFNMWFC